MIRKIKYNEIDILQDYIDKYFVENHVLCQSKPLVIHEYIDEYNLLDNPELNIYGKFKNDELQAILGYYEYPESICLSLWSSKPKTFYGIEILNYVLKEFEDKNIFVIGISDIAQKIYERMNFKVEKMNYFYYKKKSKGSFDVNIMECEEMYDSYESKKNLHTRFLYRRFIDNPFTNYKVAECDNLKVYYRKIETKEYNFLSIVYVDGDINNLSNYLDNILEKEEEEYATMYFNCNVPGMEDVYESNLTFSIYEFPYVHSNIEIFYAYAKEKVPVFKASGDYERSSNIKNKILVNNFMYHFIFEDDNNKKTRNYLLKDNFQRQINNLCKKYNKLDFHDVLDKKDINENLEYFIMSFDDGYHEHETIAMKELDSNGIKGTFALNRDNNDVVLEVNKIQMILRNYSNDELLQEIKNYEQNYEQMWKKHSVIESIDTPEVIFIKRYFQIEKNSKQLGDKLFDKLPSEYSKNYYLEKPQIFNLKKQGHIIANHTLIHKHLKYLDEKTILEDIQKYEQKMGAYLTEKLIYYPFGSNNSFVRNIYRRNGYRYGFTTEKGYSIIDLDAINLHLRRYDCIDIKE